jgi:hypothetical protein
MSINIKIDSIYDLPLSYYDWKSDLNNYIFIFSALNFAYDKGNEAYKVVLDIIDEVNKYLSPKSTFVFDGTIRSLDHLKNNNLINYDLISKKTFLNQVLKIKKELEADLSKQPRFHNPFSFESRLIRSVMTNIYFRRKKLFVTSSCKQMINVLETATFADMKDPLNKKAYLADIGWITIFTSQLWNEKSPHIKSISEYMLWQIKELDNNNSSISQVYDLLKPQIKKITKSIFNSKKPSKHQLEEINKIASYVFFRFIDYAPNTVTNIHGESLQKFNKMFLNQSQKTNFKKTTIGFTATDPINLVGYIYSNGRLKPWFQSYFKEHLSTRLKIYKTQLMIDSSNHQYLPFLEGFRFFNPTDIKLITAYYYFIQDESVDWDTKNFITLKIVADVQKATMQPKTNQESSKKIKDALFTLLVSLFEPLQKKIFTMNNQYLNKLNISSFEQKSELNQLIVYEFIKLVQEFNVNSHNRFFGYMKKMLNFRVKTSLRKKVNQKSKVIKSIIDEVPSSDKIQPDNILLESDKYRKLKQHLNKALKELSTSKREALLKSQEDKKKREPLTPAERKQNERAKKEIRTKHPELANFL